jgi:hypothetical protein
MGRRASSFRKNDVARLIDAVSKAGVSISRVEVDTKAGKISIIPGEAETSQNELDEWKASRARSA